MEYKEDGESTRVKESSVRGALASLIGGEREVKTPSGFVDMHSDALIEMKYHNRWKHGLGQVLADQLRVAGVCTSLHTSEIKILRTSRWRSQRVMRTR